MKKIITAIKKFVDKIYYNGYYDRREILVREIFPNIKEIGEYKKLSTFLETQDHSSVDRLIEVITDFYWWEVSQLSLDWKFSSIERYQWLLDFAQSLKDYRMVVQRELEDKKLNS